MKNADNKDEQNLVIEGKDKFNTRISAMSMWIERWFTSTNAKDIGTLYLIFALFSGLLGTAFSVLIRMELSGPGVQYIADNQLYNSIITAHALLMIFFMVKKYYILNSHFTFFNPSTQVQDDDGSGPKGEVNSDNNNSPLLSECNNNGDSYKSNNENKNSPNTHNYVKILVDDPYNNLSGQNKGVYRRPMVAITCYAGSTSVGLSLKHNNSFSSGHKNTHRLYSTTAGRLNMNVGSSSSKLHPYFVTGFIDGEGCFSISITSHNKTQTGWGVKISFTLDLHKKDKALLEQIRNYFGVGKIHISGEQSLQFRVDSVKELLVILDHLEKYPLITTKREVFETWKQSFNIVKNKEHLTLPGLTKVVRIKGSINRGLSDKLKTAFPSIDNVASLANDSLAATNKVLGEAEIPDPFWLAGFVSAEGCFLVNIYNSSSTKSGKGISLAFFITQHVRDSLLLTSFEKYLGCGKYSDRSDKVKVGDFAVYKYSDIVEKIIPFFDKYPILGVKKYNFRDFAQIAELMKSNAHKTPEGLDKIRVIKAGMNTKRK